MSVSWFTDSEISSCIFIVSKSILSQFNHEENVSRSLVWVPGLFVAKSVLTGTVP